MAGFSLIQSLADWQRHVASFSVSAESKFTSPESYPCLVASLRLSPEKITTCFFYVQNALELLAFAKLFPPPPATQMTGAAVDAAIPEQLRVLAADLRRYQTENSEFQKHVSAMLMAIVSEMIAVGATKQDRFEKALMAKLALVDGFHMDRVALAAESVLPEDRSVLSTLYPAEQG